MNSRNKIILGCLSLLVIASVGYALFSEKITINGSAKAKNDMDVVVTYCNQVGNELTKEEKKLDSELGFSTAPIIRTGGSCTIQEDGIIKTTGILKKPTDMIAYSVFIKNNGTTPIKIKEVNSSNNKNSYTSGVSKGDSSYIDGWTGETNEQGYVGLTGLSAFYSINELDENGYLKYKSPERPPYVNDSDSAIENANVIIPSKQSIYIMIVHGWGDNIIKPPKDGLTMNYDIQLVFEQVAQ